VSYSIYDPNLEDLLSLEGRKICYFHGITPPHLLKEYEPETAELCRKGIASLHKLAGFERVLVNSCVSKRQLEKHATVKSIIVVPPVTAGMDLYGRKASQCVPWTDPVKVVTIGRVVPHKCLEDAFRIIALARENGIRCTHRVVGLSPNPSYLAALQELLVKLRITDCVRFDGFVSQESLQSALREADLLLITSKHEGFCVPVLEAMALSKVCLVRDGTGAAYTGSQSALVFKDRKEAVGHLKRLALNPLLVARQQKASFDRANHILSTCSPNALAAAFYGNATGLSEQ
jgi:glycosyltransferase involved in cell wall biosynthesis